MGEPGADLLVPITPRRILASAHCTRTQVANAVRKLVCDSCVRWIHAKCSCQCDEMILLFHQDAAKTFGDRKFIQFVGLSNATPVLPDRLLFVRQIKLEHIFGLIRRLHGLRRNGGHTAKVVDEIGNLQSMCELFLCMTASSSAM